MTKLYHRLNKKTGVTYVYSIERSYWDKDKKSPRNKQIFLGKLDSKTGALIPAKKRCSSLVLGNSAAKSEDPITIKVVGPYLILESITHKHGIGQLLKSCFAESWQIMLSLVYFLVHKGTALSRAKPWSELFLHPYSQVITSQRVSDMLRDVSENKRHEFLNMWLKHVHEGDYLCYDITSVSSYATHNEYTQYGYNRDKESLEQINLAMLFGQKSRLPAYYRRMPGNISDVSTLKTTIQALSFLGATSLHFIMDRGFYSTSNIDSLYDRGQKFTISVPSNRKWIEAYLDKHYTHIISPSNYLEICEDEVLYVATELHKWGEKNHRGYLHIYYNAERAANDFNRFTKRLIKLKQEILEGKQIGNHETLYQRYFIIKNTTKRGLQVAYNDEEINKYRDRYSGFFCILSNKIKCAQEALHIYRNKDVVENCFDDLKNQLDMKRLRVHSAEAMDCRLFLQFLALVYISEIRSTIATDNQLKHLTVREVMEEMETLAQVNRADKAKPIFTEATVKQREIMRVFSVEAPT